MDKKERRLKRETREKWRDIVDKLEEVWCEAREKCGYCKLYLDTYCESCSRCPLYPETCNKDEKRKDNDFSEFIRSIANLVSLADKIRSAIETDVEESEE